jgi:hypothetical protein
VGEGTQVVVAEAVGEGLLVSSSIGSAGSSRSSTCANEKLGRKAAITLVATMAREGKIGLCMGIGGWLRGAFASEIRPSQPRRRRELSSYLHLAPRGRFETLGSRERFPRNIQPESRFVVEGRTVGLGALIQILLWCLGAGDARLVVLDAFHRSRLRFDVVIRGSRGFRFDVVIRGSRGFRFDVVVRGSRGFRFDVVVRGSRGLGLDDVIRGSRGLRFDIVVRGSRGLRFGAVVVLGRRFRFDVVVLGRGPRLGVVVLGRGPRLGVVVRVAAIVVRLGVVVFEQLLRAWLRVLVVRTCRDREQQAWEDPGEPQ